MALTPSRFTVDAAIAGALRLANPPPLLLGSQSASRRAILTASGAEFKTLVPDIDEKAIGDRLQDQPAALVRAIAVAKSDALVARLGGGEHDASLPEGLLPLSPGTVLLTSDQVVTYQGTIREKPTDLAQAREFVQSYATAPCGTCGGYCLHDIDSGERVIADDSTSIVFQEDLPAEVVDAVVATEELMWCAGALMIEHPAWSPYIKEVVGGLDSVMGLNMTLIARMLEELRAKISSS
jgi:septum formation protein|eukprot:COSAG06_NODE_448_length_15628_cov_10.387275_8_plen_238_part_00